MLLSFENTRRKYLKAQKPDKFAIFYEIDQAAEKGLATLHFKRKLTPEVIEIVKLEGYKIEDFSSQNDGILYIISGWSYPEETGK
jgi:predicted membrane-bound dolichyl-phosphate-mannose-protein mannosyltransferase